MAKRQIGPRSLLVAYRATNATTVEQRNATCRVKAKLNFKLPKTDFYVFPGQTLTLAKAKSKYTYIGSFTLPSKPTRIFIRTVWVSCT